MAQDSGTIVVGVDGSPEAEQALRWALREAAVHHDAVVLVHAWQFPGVGMTSFAGDPLPVFGREDIERVAGEVLERVAGEARTADPAVVVRTRLVEDHPAAALIDAAADARLLVVGCRGRGGFKGLLMGSVSSACAHHAPCPVVVVPTGDRVAT